TCTGSWSRPSRQTSRSPSCRAVTHRSYPGRSRTRQSGGRSMRHGSSWRRAGVLTLVGVVCASVAWAQRGQVGLAGVLAQPPDGRIAGAVTDADGRAVADVTIVLEGPALPQPRRATT